MTKRLSTYKYSYLEEELSKQKDNAQISTPGENESVTINKTYWKYYKIFNESYRANKIKINLNQNGQFSRK